MRKFIEVAAGLLLFGPLCAQGQGSWSHEPQKLRAEALLAAESASDLLRRVSLTDRLIRDAGLCRAQLEGMKVPASCYRLVTREKLTPQVYNKAQEVLDRACARATKATSQLGGFSELARRQELSSSCRHSVMEAHDKFIYQKIDAEPWAVLEEMALEAQLNLRADNQRGTSRPKIRSTSDRAALKAKPIP